MPAGLIRAARRQVVTWLSGAVRVRVPATSANLGPGYDSFGLALALYDVVEVAVAESGLRIEVTGVGEAAAQDGENHLVVRAMRAAFEVIGDQPPGLVVRCRNAIPQGFGLGSSAAAIVAGLAAARALAGEAGARLPDLELLRLATQIEGHADNVAACQAGGLTIAWTGDEDCGEFAAPDGGAVRGQRTEDAGVRGSGGDYRPRDGSDASPRCLRLEPLLDLTPVLCVPSVPLPTTAARAALPAAVPHSDAAANTARSALLVAALTGITTAPDQCLLLAATGDFLHQSYRAGVMPSSAELVTALRAEGVPAVISGAGPSVLALTVPGATPAPDAVAAVAGRGNQEWAVRVLAVDRKGTTVLS